MNETGINAHRVVAMVMTISNVANSVIFANFGNHEDLLFYLKSGFAQIPNVLECLSTFECS